MYSDQASSLHFTVSYSLIQFQKEGTRVHIAG